MSTTPSTSEPYKMGLCGEVDSVDSVLLYESPFRRSLHTGYGTPYRAQKGDQIPSTASTINKGNKHGGLWWA